jgi:ribose transport system substrate-binding protein
MVALAATAAANTHRAGGYSAASDGVGTAKRLVAQAMAGPGWKAPGPAFDGARAKGKTVFYISILASLPIEGNIFKGLTQATQAVGAKLVTFDGKSQASEFARGIEQAISQKAGVIVLGGVPGPLVAAPLADAKKAGIPVITARTQDVGPPIKKDPSAVVGEVTHCFVCAGRMIGDETIADSNGKAHAVLLTSSNVGLISDAETNGIKAEMKRLCPQCKLTIVDFPTNVWNTLGTRIVPILRQDPSINYILPLYDNMVVYLLPAVHAANLQNRVRIVSFNGTPAIMNFLKNKDVVVADVGDANIWQGWAIADAAFRVLAGLKPPLDAHIPERLFTAANINTINLKGDESSWYGGGNWRARYLKLWRVTK